MNMGKLQNKYYRLNKNYVYSRCALYKFSDDLATLQLATLEVPLAVKELVRKFQLKVRQYFAHCSV